MFIDTRSLGFPLTDAIRLHVESRVGAALAPVARGVISVTARLADVNAGRGGIDKRCRLVARLRRHGVVVAEATDADLYTAVAEAAARIRRSAVRVLTRHVPRERNDPQRRGALAPA
jgi:ribosome-associated translation inhibitor RaiA